MEEFIDYAKVIMGTLGHKLFEPISKRDEKKKDGAIVISDDDVRLHLERTIKNVGKVEASGIQTAEGFVVLKGILQEDMLFTSPSYAAMFVIGKSANGLTSWRTEDGQTLKSLESTEMESKTES